MNTISIDLDSLSPGIAEKLAGFILTYAGAEEIKDQLAEVYQQANDELNRSIQSAREILEPTPAEVFAQPTISSAGPTLVIPNPPTMPANVPVTQIPSGSSQAPVIAATTPVIVDKSGLPWDSRIHSSARSFNADGTWRARRGLAEGIVPQVEAELRQLMAIPSPTSAAAAPVQTAAPNIPLPPATASPSIQPYLDLMNKVSSALAGGRITSPQLQKVCDAVGLPTFVSLGTRLDLVPAVAPMIEGILAGTAV